MAAAAATPTPTPSQAISGAEPCRRGPFLRPFPSFRTTPSRHRSHSVSSSLFRRKSRKPPPTSEPLLRIVIDPEEVSRRASSSLRRFCDSYRLRFDRFVAAGDEALSDLRSLVTVDRQGRVVIACRRSTLEFLAGFAVWSFVVVAAARVLAGLLSGWRLGIGPGGWNWVRRRDRSLGGREVVVGKRLKWGRSGKDDVNPLSSVRGGVPVSSKSVVKRSALTERSKKLPDWWRSPVQSLSGAMGDEDARREVKRLARGLFSSNSATFVYTCDYSYHLHLLLDWFLFY